MNTLLQNRIDRQYLVGRSFNGIVLVLLLALTFVLTAGNVWANEPVKQGVSTAHAADKAPVAHAADTKKAHKDVKAEKGPAPSKIWIVNVLRDNAALAIFLTLALGYFIGGIKFGHFSLGAVTGTLLVGVLLGQLGIPISGQVKSMFFTMFLFAVGYSVGPQFVRGVARDGAPQAVFAVVICGICLAVTWGAAKIGGLDVGFAAGIWAGAQTISASIGLATDAINNSGAANAKEMINQIPVAYAICYLWGTIGTGMILSILGPKLIGANLEEACKQYEAEMSKGQPESGMGGAWHQVEMRAFEISADGEAVGKTVTVVEALDKKERIFAERIRRDGEIIEFDGNTVLKAGDVVAVSGPTEALITIEKHAKEVADKELLGIAVESVDLVITHKDVNGKTLLELAKDDFARGVYLQKITRGATSVDIPILAQTALHRGDILKISGTKSHITRVEKAIGYADRTSDATDMVWVGLFIVVFGLLGALTVKAVYPLPSLFPAVY